MPTTLSDEMIDFIASGPFSEEIANYHPSEAVSERVHELRRKERERTITSEEEAELDRYMDMEHLLRMAKARARMLVSAPI